MLFNSSHFYGLNFYQVYCCTLLVANMFIFIDSEMVNLVHTQNLAHTLYICMIWFILLLFTSALLKLAITWDCYRRLQLHFIFVVILCQNIPHYSIISLPSFSNQPITQKIAHVLPYVSSFTVSLCCIIRDHLQIDFCLLSHETSYPERPYWESK